MSFSVYHSAGTRTPRSRARPQVGPPGVLIDLAVIVTEPRPFADIRTTGLLWLINTTVFHPRGFALAMHFDDQGTAIGWSLMGDGTEPWVFRLEDAEADRLFAAVQAVFAEQAAATPQSE